MPDDHDTLQRFLFEHLPVRGELVRLDATWQAVQQRHDYPAVLRQAMGELMAAAALLAATLKLKGSLILQIQGHGPLSLLVVEASGDLAMRATAKWRDDLPEGGFRELVGDGRFVIILDPRDGKQTYQGIVPLQGDSVAEILQNYMTRSEQLESRLWLAADATRAAGLLLQKLPERTGQESDDWDRLGHLAATLSARELLLLPARDILRRLFHEDDLHLFDPQPVSFRCGCSKASVANMLRMLGREEVRAILAERGEIEVHCDFCNRRYAFDAVDAEQLFTTAAPGSDSRH